MSWSLRLVVKQHRYELALAVLLSVVVGLAAFFVIARFGEVAVPGGCIGAWDALTPATGSCLPYLEAFGRIYFEQGGKVLAAMAVLPAVVGLLGGVPIVGRELETGTTQFAWAIAPSRLRWLMRQLSVVGLILVIAFGFTALAAEALETTRRSSMAAAAFENIGLHGILALVRMLAALMVGLFLGALIGRTLPAFVVAALVVIGLVLVSGPTRDAWAAMQPHVIVESAGGSTFDGEVTGLAWMDRTGHLTPYAEGPELVPPSNQGDPDSWLLEHGYEQVQLGISNQTARSWEPLEIAGWVAVAVAFLISAAWLVTRRRPV